MSARWPRRARLARWFVSAVVLAAIHALGSTVVATESRCWPLTGSSICLEIRPAAVPGEVGLHVLRRDAAGDTELLRREGGFADLVVDASWTAWRGRVEMLPGGTEATPRVDVTGDGRANVLVRGRPSAGCCERWLVLELGHEVRVIFDDLAANDGDRPFVAVDRRGLDVVGDGWAEIVVTDALAWPEPCGAALGAPPRVVTVFAFDRRLRAYAPSAPRTLAVHEAPLRVALERLLGELPSSTPLERGAWLLPDFWFGRDFTPAASWCDALPLVTALLAAGRPRDAWAAFDVWYRGDDHAEVKAWLQGSWWWTAPWRWERGLDAFAGEWIGELATFVIDASGAMDLVGGGRPIDVSVWGDGAVGERVGELTVFGRDFESHVPACPLLRGLDRVDGFVLVDGCNPKRRYVVRPAASGTAIWLEEVLEPRDPSLRSGAHLVRAPTPLASDGADVDALAFGERLLDASCRGLRVARNEVFARHGWVFAAGALADAFASEPWYVPAGDAWSRAEANSEIAAALPDADRVAVQLLVALERARGCAQVDDGFDELIEASEEQLRSLAPALADRLADEASAWETYLAACEGRRGRATDACQATVLVERWRRAQAAYWEVRE